MVQLEEQIKNLQAKIQQLLKLYHHLQKENQQLKKEIEKHQLKVSERDEKLGSLQQQVDVLKIGAHGWSDGAKKELEKRIETYLKEVEKCLALLNA